MPPSPARKILPYAALGALGIAGTIGLVYALRASTDPRTKVANAANSQIGATDASVYWADVLQNYPSSSYPPDWCGAFALWCLHQAGLATGIEWTVGLGFLSGNLPTTQQPEVGDIAYFNTNEHHAVVVGVDYAAGTVDLVNGNGTGGAVSASTGPMNHPTAYYSIAGLLPAAPTASSDLPWIAGSVVVLGAGAWFLLPSGE
jgi:hypothetical protein